MYGIVCGVGGCLSLFYDFIFESVYLGDGFRLVVMLSKFLRIWSCYEFVICLYIYIDDFFGGYVRCCECSLDS